MKLLNTALVIALSVWNVANAAAVPTASSDVAMLTSDAVARQDPPAHGMCYLYLNIVEKKPQNPQDIDTTVWVALSDGQNKTIEGMTYVIHSHHDWLAIHDSRTYTNITQLGRR